MGSFSRSRRRRNFDHCGNPRCGLRLYLYVGATGQTFFTQSNLNPTGDKTHEHFAVFIQNGQSDPVYWIGIEDLPAGNSTLVKKEGKIGDYNDMVVRIAPIAAVPEPGTLALFGTGLPGIAGMVRRGLGRKQFERR